MSLAPARASSRSPPPTGFIGPRDRLFLPIHLPGRRMLFRDLLEISGRLIFYILTASIIFIMRSRLLAEMFRALVWQPIPRSIRTIPITCGRTRERSSSPAAVRPIIASTPVLPSTLPVICGCPSVRFGLASNWWSSMPPPENGIRPIPRFILWPRTMPPAATRLKGLIFITTRKLLLSVRQLGHLLLWPPEYIQYPRWPQFNDHRAVP